MREETRRRVLERLRSAIEDPSREVPRRTTRLDIARYVDPEELALEEEILFGQRPIAVAHASELEAPGDFVTEQLGEVPLLVVRDEERVRVLVNACRHRGARLVAKERGCAKIFTCPYHAWTYRMDGRLAKVPHEESFVELDKEVLRLKELPSEVRHGFVWASPGGPVEVAPFLGPMVDDDLTAFGLDTHRVEARHDRVKAANWKLVIDAFAEGYHLESLHGRSLARFFLATAICDDAAPHVRQVGARKSLRDADGLTLADFRKNTTVFYDLFPNTVLVFHPHWVSALTVFPRGVDHVRVVHRMLVPRDAPDDAREKRRESFDLIDGQVFENEDLAIAQSIQSTLRSGASTHVVLGGLEEGMRLFHAARDRALGRTVDDPG